MNKAIIHLIILFVVFIFLSNSIAMAEDELEPRFELGFNMGAITANDRESYFGESSYFYPEVGAWVNIDEKVRFGVTSGFIYIEYEDITKTISIFPMMLEMSFLYVESGFEDPKFFMEFGLGLGFFISVGDVYHSANAWSLKIGTGLMSEDLMFSINAKVIGCRAKTSETFSYIIDPIGNEEGNIKEEMNLGGVAITIGVGVRY